MHLSFNHGFRNISQNVLSQAVGDMFANHSALATLWVDELSIFWCQFMNNICVLLILPPFPYFLNNLPISHTVLSLFCSILFFTSDSGKFFVLKCLIHAISEICPSTTLLVTCHLHLLRWLIFQHCENDRLPILSFPFSCLSFALY